MSAPTPQGTIAGPQATKPRAQFAWIFNPAADLIIGCGAWSAPLIALVYFLGASKASLWGAVFYALALAFNYPHYMATIYRAYHTREDFSKYRFFTVYLTLLLGITAVVVHASPRLLPWIFTLYVNWSPWHYTGQNYGLLMMFARRHGAQITTTERRYLHGAFVASFLLLLLSFHSGRSSDPLVLSLALPAQLTVPLQIVFGLAFAGFGNAGLKSLVRQIGLLAAVEPITLFLTQFLWFVLPSVIGLFQGISAPQTRYSTGVLALMHAAQYIWITSYYAKKEASGENKKWHFAAYFGTLVIGGIALFVPGPWLVSYLFRYDFTSSFLIFTALVNIHHFLLDGAIWKLRDGRIAALLLSARTQIAERGGEAGGMAFAAARWIFAPAKLQRTLRYVCVGLLLLWAGVDQLKFLWTVDRANLDGLLRARRLNPHDSTVENGIAAWLQNDGQIDRSILALRHALAINPNDAIARSSMIDLLVKQQRMEEAYQAAKEMPLPMRRDPSIWVNTGVLASQTGRYQEAADDFQRALALDPDQWGTHLLLADSLERAGKPQQAADEYQTYLEFVASHKDEYQPPPGTLVPAVLNFGAALQQIGADNHARAQYDLAISLAHKTSQPALESFAYMAKAGLEEKTGRKSDAAHAYQHALTLDRSLNSAHAEGIDWFAYGKFLQGHQYPARLAYACFTKAGEMLKLDQAKAGSDLDVVTRFQNDAGQQLGQEAEKIRTNLDPVLAEALAAN